MASHHRFLRILAALLLALALLGQARPSSANPRGAIPRADTALDIINLVNALRASYGLAPYQIDAGVMAFAQQHSEYQASIKTWTHTHSDGTTSLAHGMRENVATGQAGFMTPEFAVYTVWADAIHMDPMVGYASGYVGAGVASDGTDVYYTLNVRPGTGRAGSGSSGSGAGARGTGTPIAIIPIEPLVTITPRADGWNVHTVGYGQTLWAISQAYAVPADMIRAWNSMEADSNEIYAGQKLIIRAPTGAVQTAQAAGTAAAAAAEAVANAEITATGIPATGVPAASVEPTTSLAMVAAQATASPTSAPPPAAEVPAPSDAPAEAGPLAAGLLILIGGTLLVVLAFSMVKKG